MKKPIVLAIVIPYYKRAFLDKTLLSLVQQSCQNFVVYIGDDASLESPSDILAKFSCRIQIYYQKFSENLGSISLISHWERCIGMVNSEKWIMLLGDDDYLSRNVVQSFYQSYHQFNCKTNLIRFSTQLVNEDSELISKVFRHPLWEKTTDSFFRKYKNESRSSLSEYIFRKKIYEKHKFRDFPLAWYSDDYAWLEFAEDKPVFSIDTNVFIRFSNLSISGKTDNSDLKSTARLMFYRTLIKEKLIHFTSHQRSEILSYYEKLLKSEGFLTFSNVIILSYFHLKYFRSQSILKFYTRLAKSLFKQ